MVAPGKVHFQKMARDYYEGITNSSSFSKEVRDYYEGIDNNIYYTLSAGQDSACCEPSFYTEGKI